MKKMELKLSLKRVLLDILSIKKQVYESFKDKEEYRKLLILLMEKDYYEDEDIPIPTLKEIEISLGLSSQQLRKMLKNIYNEFFSYENTYKMKFHTTEIHFYLDYLKRFASFKCEELIYLPKVGENIEIPFLKATIGIDFFYVQDVKHIFEGIKHIIEIRLKGGNFNSYWYYRKHKAYELGEIGILADYKMYEHEIKRLLGIRD